MHQVARRPLRSSVLVLQKILNTIIEKVIISAWALETLLFENLKPSLLCGLSRYGWFNVDDYVNGGDSSYIFSLCGNGPFYASCYGFEILSFRLVQYCIHM